MLLSWWEGTQGHEGWGRESRGHRWSISALTAETSMFLPLVSGAPWKAALPAWLQAAGPGSWGVQRLQALGVHPAKATRTSPTPEPISSLRSGLICRQPLASTSHKAESQIRGVRVHWTHKGPQPAGGCAIRREGGIETQNRSARRPLSGRGPLPRPKQGTEVCGCRHRGFRIGQRMVGSCLTAPPLGEVLTRGAREHVWGQGSVEE